MANKRLYTILKEYLTKVFPIAEGGTGASTATGAVSNLKSDIVNLIYPVGSIYISYNSTSPATLFGGTWTQLKDRFLLGAGSTYSNGATGGEATVALTVTTMPAHNHPFTGSSVTTSSAGAHSHDIKGGANWNGSATGVESAAKFSTVMDNTNSIQANGYHRHSFTPSGTVGNNGAGTAHNNMPPYLVVYMWKRTA